MIPIYKPALSGNEKKYVLECLNSTWISSKGQFIDLFEKKFSSYIGIKFATSVSSGTVALHLALLALGIGPGDEVIVPTLTYIASVNAISYTGATPVFVDSLISSWQMDPEEVSKKITKKTKAIMAVHLYGHPCDMDALVKITRENNLFLIEDCAEAFGSKFSFENVGTFGDISTFSFFGNKTITTGEGGMVVTNNEEIFKKLVLLKGQGVSKEKEYWHEVIGYNYRMTNICAAIGLAQMEQAEEILIKKGKIAFWYKKYLKNSPIEFHEEIGDVYHSYWMVSFLVKNANLRDSLREQLKKNKVETRPLFYPIHTMPMYFQKDLRFPVAESLGSRGINLPSWPELEEELVVYICEKINDFYNFSFRNESPNIY